MCELPIKSNINKLIYIYIGCDIVGKEVHEQNLRLSFAKSCLKSCHYYLEAVWKHITSSSDQSLNSWV